MVVDLIPGWTLEMDRGPDWLFIRPVPPKDKLGVEVELAEAIWERMEQQFCHRVVIEMDQVPMLRSWLVGQLALLHKRVTSRDGLMRMCGVSDSNHEVLKTVRLDDRFPQYADRGAAVMGYRPKPR
ncbi:STAS domain-containing protein [Anatilimnocola floriformis]|uniref:STAS domain-containing protein n=1 Tax=Anatilimnocola floriformis TaxID=2948575 RepID=UPI0020C4BAC3|nr:STAS domain-containing protein [Anatilimnocola floriformis]